MPHLPLHVKKVGVVPYRINGIRVSKLVGREVRYPGPFAKLPQVLPHSPGCQAAPDATGAGDKQGIQAEWQGGNGGANFEPAAHVFRRGFVENNNSIGVGFLTADKSGSVILFNVNIAGCQRGQFANPQPGIECQRPQSQGADIKPVAFALIGRCLKVVKELYKFGASRRTGQEFWSRGTLGQLNRIRRQLATLGEPGTPNLDGFVIALDAGLFQPALFTVEQEGINSLWRGWEVRARESTELVEGRLVKKDGFWRLAGFGLKELLNSAVEGSEVLRLDKDQVFSGRACHRRPIYRVLKDIWNSIFYHRLGVKVIR